MLENLVLRYIFFFSARVLEHAKEHLRLIESNHPTSPLTHPPKHSSHPGLAENQWPMPGEFDSNEVQLATHLAQRSKFPPSISPIAALASRTTEYIKQNGEVVVVIKSIMSRRTID